MYLESLILEEIIMKNFEISRDIISITIKLYSFKKYIIIHIKIIFVLNYV